MSPQQRAHLLSLIEREGLHRYPNGDGKVYKTTHAGTPRHYVAPWYVDELLAGGYVAEEATPSALSKATHAVSLTAKGRRSLARARK